MTARLRGTIASNALLVDLLIATGLTALSVTAVVGGARDAGRLEPVSVTLLLLQTLPLVFRRVTPVAVLIVCYAATFAHIYLAFGLDNVYESIGALVALYTVAELRDRRTSVVAAIVIGISFGIVFLAAGVLPSALTGLFQTELSVILGWVFGDFARTRSLLARLTVERDQLLTASK